MSQSFQSQLQEAAKALGLGVPSINSDEKVQDYSFHGAEADYNNAAHARFFSEEDEYLAPLGLNVWGEWVHFFQHGDIEDLVNLKGEVCVSVYDSEERFVLPGAKEEYKPSCLVMRGVATATFDSDVWSVVVEQNGVKLRKAQYTDEDEHTESWVVPANIEDKFIVTLDKEVYAKAKRLGVVVVFANPFEYAKHNGIRTREDALVEIERLEREIFKANVELRACEVLNTWRGYTSSVYWDWKEHKDVLEYELKRAKKAYAVL